jgi:hypothetical protein
MSVCCNLALFVVLCETTVPLIQVDVLRTVPATTAASSGGGSLDDTASDVVQEEALLVLQLKGIVLRLHGRY